MDFIMRRLIFAKKGRSDAETVIIKHFNALKSRLYGLCRIEDITLFAFFGEYTCFLYATTTLGVTTF